MKTVIKSAIISATMVGLLFCAYMMSAHANADPWPCPIGQRTCQVTPGYNAPSNQWEGTPGQWTNGHYTPITENPYGRGKCTYRIGC